MPSSAQPVLSLAFNNISKIDRIDCDQLSSLWTVFTKCAESLENGRRLENLSWRLWYRECQLNDRDIQRSLRKSEEQSLRPPMKRERTCSSDGVPQLSTSIDSASTVDHKEQHVSESPDDRLRLQQHLTPGRFHALVNQFGHEPVHQTWMDRPEKPQEEERACCPAATPMAMTATDEKKERSTTPEQVDYMSIKVRNGPFSVQAQEPAGALRRASSVVHGFHPSLVSIKKPLHGQIAPHRISGPAEVKTEVKQMFFIDSNSSGSDAEGGLPGSKRGKRKKSQLRAVLPAVSCSPKMAQPKKRRSFKEIVDQGSGYDSSPFDSDEDSDAASKIPKRSNMDSAIMSDDEESLDGNGENDDDWASVCTESRANSFSENKNVFDKMDTMPEAARPVIASRKSLLSTLFTDPTVKLSNAQSRSSPAIAQSRRASPSSSPPSGPLATRRQAAADASLLADTLRAQPAVSATDIRGSVSPRTTRRNMLSTELSESLRKHLLWERRQKPSNANNAAQAVLKRRHTAFDMTQLNAYPQGQDGRPSEPVVPIAAEATTDDFGYNGCGW